MHCKMSDIYINNKRSIKQLSNDVQVKWLSFMIKIIIYSFPTHLTHVYTTMSMEMRALPRDKCLVVKGLEANKKNWRDCILRYSCNNQHMKIYSPLYFWKGSGFSVLIYKISNIDGETCTAKWVIFLFILWRLIGNMFTVLSETSLLAYGIKEIVSCIYTV